MTARAATAVWVVCACIPCVAIAMEHVPPDPPQAVMGEMSYKEMASMMQMDDTRSYGTVILDQLEWRNTQGGDALAWDAQGSYGGDYNKLWVKTEGRGPVDGAERRLDACIEALADRVVARWWDAQVGVRRDFGKGPARTWLAVGLQGLAPYWLDVEATVYMGEGGRTAARVKVNYDLLLTQRLILQPYSEVNLYGKADPQRLVGSGVSDFELSMRLRYEIRREWAPYLGVGWFRRFGQSANLARAVGEGSNEAQLVAGMRVWF